MKRLKQILKSQIEKHGLTNLLIRVVVNVVIVYVMIRIGIALVRVIL